MPALAAILANVFRAMLLANVGKFVLKIFGVIVISYATNKFVMDPALDTIRSYLNGSYGGGEIGMWVLSTLGMLRFDVACSILIGAYSTRASLQAAEAILVKN